MEPFRSRWRRTLAPSRILVILGSLAVIALIWGFAVERVRFEREQVLLEVRRDNDNLAIGLEEHTRRILRNVNQALAFVRYEYLEHGKPIDVDDLLARGDIVRQLFASLVVVDEHGEVVDGWGEFQRDNKTDYAYFRGPRDHDTGKLFVGVPRADRRTGMTVIDFALRLTRRNGQFAGVAVAKIDPARLAEFYELGSMSGNDLLMVVGLDGITRARRVGASVTSGENMAGSSLMAHQARRPRGALESRGRHNAVPRFVSWRTLESFPLIVAVGSSQAESMATFAHHREDYYFVAAIASIAVVVLALVLLVAQARKRRALGELVQSESRFRAIFDQAFVGMGQHTLDGRAVRVNQKLCSMLGYAPEELLGAKPGKVTHPDDAPATGDFNGEFQVGERRFLRKDGGVMWGKAAWTLVRDSEGRPDCYVSVVADITEFKRIDQMKNEFISMVSHELRTPLTSIRGSLGLVAGGVAGALPDAVRKLVDIAKNNCERLIRLINDILDTEKIESGKMHFELEETDLGRLLEAAIAANEGFAAQHDVKLALRRPGEPVTVNVDSDRLNQVITNLLSNAVKFSPAGHAVDVTLSERAGRARVEVRDHGAGVPEEFRTRMFQKFSQADSSDTRAKGGTGLGLNISKAIVERLGGVIGFDTPQGDGAIFYIELPMQRAPGAPHVGALVRPRILVCEHDPEIARLIAAMLAKAGFDADLAFNAADGHAQATRGGYAAMTVDPGLPDRDGASLIRVLRAEPRTAQLPILVVFAVYREGHLQINGESAAAPEWIEMPSGGNSLVQAVRHAVKGPKLAGRPRILHVEPDPDVQRITAAIADDFAFEVAGTLWEARARLAQGNFDLVLLELRLADGSGWNLVREIEARSPRPPVVVFSVDDARAQDNPHVAAMLVKAETSNERLLETIRRVLSV